MLFQLLYTLVTGALVGWIAGRLMNAEGGLLRNIAVGIVGSVMGGLVCYALGFYAYGFFARLAVSIAGSCLFIWLGRKLFH